MTSEEAMHREAIRALVERYSFHSDRGQFAEVAACFAADGEVRWQTAGCKGPAAIEATLKTATRNPAIRFVRHHLTTIHITIAPDMLTATGRVYYFTISSAGFDHGGVYADAYVREGEDWLLSFREARIDWQSPQSLYTRQPDAPLLFTNAI